MVQNKQIYGETFLGAFSAQSWKEMMNFIFEKIPFGIIIFDSKNKVIFSNRKGRYFLRLHELPDEIIVLNRKIFDSIGTGKFAKLFPGEIYLNKKLDKSTVRCTFKFEVCEKPEPIVCVFVSEESSAEKISFNKIRRDYGLSRREVDVLRRIVSGLKQEEICEELEISPQVAKEYLGSLYVKFGVSNRNKLVSVLESLPER